MKNNKFKYIREGVESEINELKQSIDEYNSSILELKKLINTISTSMQWKDEEVKTSFINTSTSYIKIYEDFNSKINERIKYLERKANVLNKIDAAYKR